MRNSVELESGGSGSDGGQVGYILPQRDSSNESLCAQLSALFRCKGQNPSTADPFGSKLSRRLANYGALLFTLFVVITSTSSLILLHQWWTNGGRNWDEVRMGRLQPVLLEQVRTLMVTANRSIHDPKARQLLRNLSKEDPDTCYSPNCLHTGLTLLESMNFSVDPCQDFYQFSCGSWTHSMGDGQSNSQSAPQPSLIVNADQFSKINEKVIRATQKILEESPTQTDTKTFAQAQKLYSQCKDLDQLERDGLQSLWTLIDSYGGWPLLNQPKSPLHKWNNSFDWILLVGDLQRLSCSSILSLEVKQHPTDPLQNIIYIVQPKFFLSREYLLTPEKYPKILQAYKEFFVGLSTEFLKFGQRRVSNFSGPVNLTKLESIADEVIRFEKKLAKLSSDELEPGRLLRKAQYPLHTLQRETEFMTPKNPRYPKNKIDWLRFLKRVFLSSGLELTEEERVVVADVSYVRGLTPLLSFTSESTLANYLVWRLVVTFSTGTTEKLRKLNFNFYNVVFGMKRIPLRTATCATVVKDAFALAIGMKIVKGMTEVSSKREVEEMVENVRVSMESLLASQQLGPALLLIGISRKLNTLKHCIGYPSSFQNSSGIEYFYHNLEFKEEDEVYLRKYIRLRFWHFDKTLATLRLPFDSDCWSGAPWANIGEAYAYYDTARNSINFPIGLLQAPFYRHNVPVSVNYGAIGAIIGHEISHSINFEGWIKVGLVQQLELYWDCLLHHYNNYKVPELGPESRVNGLRTRSENLADHLGLAASYWAFEGLQKRDRLSGSRMPRTLVGLDLFSPRQLFFISFAHMWCVSGPDEWLADELESSSHTPGRYRVLGSLQNSEDFAKSFNCPIGSEMNPKNKCNTLLTASQTRD